MQTEKKRDRYIEREGDGETDREREIQRDVCEYR